MEEELLACGKEAPQTSIERRVGYLLRVGNHTFGLRFSGAK